MSDEFEYYMSEINAVCGKIDREMAKLSTGKCNYDLCDGLFKESEIAMKSAMIEARMADSDEEKKKMLASVEELKSTLVAQKKKLNSSRLMAGSSGLGSEDPTSAGDRQRMERITSKIENQNEMILNAQRAVAETEEVGNDIVEELKGNREKIVSVRDKTTELNANVDDAATRLDSMQRREKCVIS